MTEELLLELSEPGRVGYSLPALDVPEAELPDSGFLRKGLALPEVSEVDVVRHFTRLSRLNYAIDIGFYPLGSCTMKYNPKLHEEIAALPGFAFIHPYQGIESVQGALAVMFGLQGLLAEISGLSAVSLQPAAGAQGELSGILVARAYHLARGDNARKVVLVPDSAHGTNPATASMCGFEVRTVRSDAQGNVDMGDLRAQLSLQVAALMLTLPNTLGLFDPNIEDIVALVHEQGGLVYCDGANMNALLGQLRPGDLGVDLLHLNLHKTFSTPHGGGGPGAGPLCVRSELADFLPGPVIATVGGKGYQPVMPPRSIGRVKAFYGNFGVLLRAYCYIRSMGAAGLRQASEDAVLSANYLKESLKGAYLLPYDRPCMHEVVLSGARQKAKGVRTLDIAKRLIDYGFHPPTIYFPLVVEEALMIEPTETESLQSLDRFVTAMLAIAEEVEREPEKVLQAPLKAPVGRLDEAAAARKPRLHW